MGISGRGLAYPLLLVMVMTACGKDGKERGVQVSPPEPARPTANLHVVPDDVKVMSIFEGVLKPGHQYRAVVKLQKGGEFEILFYPAIAPTHVANFVSLARRNYYDDVTFHRVLEGFMAQGGDPTGTGSGGPGYMIPAEFSKVPHERGTVSMARTPDPNSAGSQFFICFDRSASVAGLDGQYTVFGQVVRGMEHVDGLKRRDPMRNPDFEGDRIADIEIIETSASAS